MILITNSFITISDKNGKLIKPELYLNNYNKQLAKEINTSKYCDKIKILDELKELTRMVNKNLKSIKHHLDYGISLL